MRVVTDNEVQSEFTNRVYDLCSNIRAMADTACQNRDVEAVYFLVTQERKLLYMLRTMEMRNIIKRP